MGLASASPFPAKAQSAAPVAAAAARPACELILLDGTSVAASSIDGGVSGHWRLGAPGRGREVDADAVLAVVVGPVPSSRLPAAHLAGGDVVRGLLVGGDAAGDRLELQSPVLGPQRLPVDRLDCLVLQPELARAEDLVLPAGEVEALFLKATLGFDRVVGTLHRFGEPGIRFQQAGREEPEWFPVRDLVGLRLGGAVPAPTGAIAQLWTRGGDCIGVRDFVFAGDALRVALENGDEVTVPLADVGCLVRQDRGAVFASALEPAEVAEAAVGGDVLLPWRRDQSVTGAPLVADGRCYGRGLGVHSRSRLAFTVPAGSAAFCTRVAFDDTARRLPVQGAVDVAVLLDGSEVFRQQALGASEAPRTVGPIAVRPGQILTLAVDFGPGRDLGDRVAWLLPVFVPAR